MQSPPPPALPPSPLACHSLFFTRSLETNGGLPQPLKPAEVERDRLEFSVQPITPAEESFRHSGWRHQRRQVFEALQQTQQPAAALSAFVNCGSGCRVLVSESTQEVRLAANHCKSRFCIPCGVARGAKISRHVLAHMPKDGVRFLTLTLRHNHLPLSDQVTRCLVCFRLLRAQRAWKDHVEGGVSFLELKRSGIDGLWHVHLHVLIIGTYFEQKQLSKMWQKATGDSSIVHIEAVKDPKQVSGYVAKYAAKPLDAATANHRDSLQEIVIALKGRRMFTTFGSWRGVDLDAADDALHDWIDLGSLDQLLDDARLGDAQASKILSQIVHISKAKNREHGPPCLADTIQIQPDQDVP